MQGMSNSAFKYDLGITVRDKITNVEGVVTGRHEYLTGCVQYSLQPTGLDKDGKIRESYYLDEGRLDPVAKKKPIEMNASSPNGGPQRRATRPTPRKA